MLKFFAKTLTSPVGLFFAVRKRFFLSPSLENFLRVSNSTAAAQAVPDAPVGVRPTGRRLWCLALLITMLLMWRIWQ